MDIWTAEKIILLGFLLKAVCCRNFNISLPQNIQALSGSCVIIKCRFEIQEQYDKDLTESATGLWLKDGENKNEYLVFHSTDHKPNHFNGTITGKLHEGNCTTIFYNVSSRHIGRYYFRIESAGLKYVYNLNTSTINVLDSPPKPTVHLYVDQKEVQDQEEVLEGSSVSLRCSAGTLCSSPPPTLTWSSTPRIPLRESSRREELISDLNFTATHRQHRVTFTCTITYQLQDQNKTAQDNITVHVQDSPKNTSVSVLPSSSVLEGSSVTVTCSSEANPAVNYTWSRESEGQMKQLQTGDTLTFDMIDLKHRGWYYCTAHNQHGTQNSSVMLDIQYAPKNTSVSVLPSSSVLEGSSVTLTCSSEANPAVNYTWSRESEGQMKQLQTGDTLTFDRIDLKHRGWYYCTAHNQHGTQNSSVMLDIQYSPKNTSVSVLPSSSVLEGSSVTLTCSSEANPAVNYTWSRESEGQMKQLQTGDTLTFDRIDLKHRGWYYCTAHNQHGTQNSSVMLDIQYAPKNTSASVNTSSSVLEGSSVTLTCNSEANPAVNYTWSRESEGQMKQLPTGDTLTFDRIDLKHRGWYYCTAHNQHGTQNSSVMLDIQYAPKISPFFRCTRTDVTLCFCEADGNPSPELEWHLSGRPVINSSNTFISVERLSSTGLRSSITLHQSLTHTFTLQCVSRNTHGTASHQFNLLHVSPQVSGFHHFSFLVGVAGGASVMMIICGILLICARRESNPRGDGDTGLILTDREDESGPVCANNAMLSPTGAATQNCELNYAPIDFTNIQPKSEEIRGISSLTAEYAVVQRYPGRVSGAESSTEGDQPNSGISAVMKSEKNPTILEQESKMGEVLNKPLEETIYQIITI
ncbi:Schwann cell myelin protein-like [Carassius carassius]|uniref:Schwann cell myelin protein-like n=1 Tax=Carassius carassius TaxID=217509 RepID=UPI0028691146|nr:Schwann cell myelin protein-like [Carassius carassius]XP_059361354.1 Schwann cell myelin protein-like [Carassius carassius]